MIQKRTKEFYRNVIPCVLSMVTMALFSVVDGVFVSRGVGSDALAGLNVVYPMVLVLVALSAMLALGVSTMIATRLAVGKVKEANQSISSCLWFSVIAFAVMGIIALCYRRRSQGC